MPGNFERLRRIHQLGGDFQVYHTAGTPGFLLVGRIGEIVRRMVSEIPALSASLSPYEKCAVMLADCCMISAMVRFHMLLRLSATGHHELFTQRILLEKTARSIISWHRLIKGFRRIMAAYHRVSSQ